MNKTLTANDVLDMVEEQSQRMREDGPADMREMIAFTKYIRKQVKHGAPRWDILQDFYDSDFEDRA